MGRVVHGTLPRGRGWTGGATMKHRPERWIAAFGARPVQAQKVGSSDRMRCPVRRPRISRPANAGTALMRLNHLRAGRRVRDLLRLQRGGNDAGECRPGQARPGSGMASWRPMSMR
ncbi:hypothetical protein BIWAKO_06036 [Bosea sp. BIWAKO-01]|nr:hypothetical protein BIWAKO_06036 [Bosea sp. BIWAKO-01]